MNFIDRVKQLLEFKKQEQYKKQGIVTPLPTVQDPQFKIVEDTPSAIRGFQQTATDFGNAVINKFPDWAKPQQVRATFEDKIRPFLTPTSIKSNSISVPTASPTPTPTPIMTTNRVDPITPQNIPSTYYTNRNSKIEPKLWDAINTASPTGDLQLNDFMKRMALALATQESGGGYTLEGDNGKSMGPYHIQRESVPVADRYNPDTSTKLVFQEMIRNMLKNGVPKEKSLRTWNWNSGYGNNGPKYNVDIPQMATTSSFYKGL
jgi:hypothetical protein